MTIMAAKRGRGSIALLVVAGLLVLAAGCSDDGDGDSGSANGDDDTAAEETTTTADRESSSTNSDGVARQPEGQSGFFDIQEVLFTPDDGFVLRNITDVEVSTDRLFVCQAEECFALPDTVVPAGETVLVTTGSAEGSEGAVIEGLAIGDLKPVDGEIAVYVSDPEDPEKIVGYLEWGSTPHSRTEAAVARGQWLADTFAPTGENAVRLFRNTETGLWLWDAS